MDGKRAFTLVELLVVVVIAAAVAAILLPAAGRALVNEEQAVCSKTLKALYDASMMYALANDEYFMPARNPGSAPDIDDGKWWTQIMMEYGMNPRNSDEQVRNHGGVRCPAETGRRYRTSDVFSDYLINHRLGGHSSVSAPFDSLCDGSSYGTYAPWRLPDVIIPHHIGLFSDSAESGAPWYHYDLLRAERGISFRHTGGIGANIVFVSGDVEIRMSEQVLGMWPWSGGARWPYPHMGWFAPRGF